MTTVQQVCQFLEAFAPPRLAEEWDNVGLLVGDRDRTVARMMTCLTITPEVVEEAISQQAQLIVTHHPLPFRPLKRITSESVAGGMLLRLIEHRVAVYSPHTCFDSAQQGINQHLANGFGIVNAQPIAPIADDPDQLGAGRCGSLAQPTSLGQFAELVKSFLRLDGLHVVGASQHKIARVAVACGSAGQFLEPALRADCDCLVTGETSFHTCLEAKANGAAMVLTGHYASERFALDWLAKQLNKEFADTTSWASTQESDPLCWV